MYYHCRELKYVTYGKIDPPPRDSIDEEFLKAYDWLGRHCGYSPQIWLSRSRSNITGYRSSNILKKQKCVQRKRSEVRDSKKSILFGFDVIKGFPVKFDEWDFLLCCGVMNKGTTEAIAAAFNEIIKDVEEYNEELDGVLLDWIRSERNLETYLKKYVFVEHDQVVVPSLNLKTAKKIICPNEKTKKALRKMGFIEDRIQIKNLKNWDW